MRNVYLKVKKRGRANKANRSHLSSYLKVSQAMMAQADRWICVLLRLANFVIQSWGRLEGRMQSSELSIVIDLYEYFPAELLSHRVIELSLLHTWQYNNQGRSAITTTWIQVAKTVCAPR